MKEIFYSSIGSLITAIVLSFLAYFFREKVKKTLLEIFGIEQVSSNLNEVLGRLLKVKTKSEKVNQNLLIINERYSSKEIDEITKQHYNCHKELDNAIINFQKYHAQLEQMIRSQRNLKEIEKKKVADL